MGIYTDLATGSSTIKPEAPRVGLDKASAHQLLNKAAIFDPTIGSDYAAADETSRIDQLTGTPTAGTYTLTFTMPTTDETFTTAGIAYNAAASVIETAIDTAATTAAITDWTNGDISVSEENTFGLSDGYCDFLCENAVGEMPVIITIDTSSVTGIGGAQTITRSTPGQGDRNAAQALFEMNVVEGTLHNSGEAPTDWVKPTSPTTKKPRAGLIKDLAWQATIEDGTDDAYDAVAALYDLP